LMEDSFTCGDERHPALVFTNCWDITLSAKLYED
jgi:hypothetical protein